MRTACYDHTIVQWLEAHTVGDAIVAALTPRLQRRVAAARYHAAGARVAIAEFRDHPIGWPGARRFIALRRPIPEEPSWPLSLFRLEQFESRRGAGTGLEILKETAVPGPGGFGVEITG